MQRLDPYTGSSQRQFWRYLVAVLTAAAVLRLLLWAPGLSDMSVWVGGDTPDYLWLGESLSRGYLQPGSAAFDLGVVRPPGYPAVLAPVLALTDNIGVVALYQAAIGVALVAATALVGRHLLGAFAGLVAGSWVALDPVTATESTVILTETPFALLLLVVAGGIHHVLGPDPRPHRVASAGLALAAATFVRPISAYLPVLLLPLLIASRPARSRWKAPTVFALTALLPVFMWVGRNQVVDGAPVFSAIEGRSFLNYRAAGAVSEQEDRPLEEVRRELAERLNEKVTPATTTGQRSRIATTIGVQEIIRHPSGYATMATEGAARTLFGPGGAELADRLPDALYVPALAVSVASATGLFFIGLAGAASLWRERRDVVIATAAPVLYLLVVGSGLESYSRFRVPMVPALAILASGAISRFLHNHR